MPEQPNPLNPFPKSVDSASYKILAAQRLNLDPAELLMYFELRDHAIVTTPDGKQHIFSFASLDRPAPAKDLAETAQKVAKSPSAAARSESDRAISIAPKKAKK